jgi:hypothetical protein
MPPRLSAIASILVYAAVCGAQPPAPFEFHNGFWINLHQFLIHQSAAPDDSTDPPDWRDALSYYRRLMPQQDVMSREAEAVNNSLADAASAPELPSSAVDPELRAVLSRAAPVYRSRWWQEHNLSNQAWIDAVLPLLAKHGASMCKDIAAAWQTSWPPTPIRVDVVAYAGPPTGAYTTLEPTHVTISSARKDYQGDAALEMLFHEASHSLDGKVRAALEKERLARGVLFKIRGFSHAVLFYTAGEITRRHLPGYEMYGVRNHIFTDGWPGSLPVLEKDWKPYLEGRTDLTSAVQALVAAYGVPK